MTTFVALAGIYLLLCAAAYFYQGKLIFPGAKASVAQYAKYADSEIVLQRDKFTLRGWREAVQQAPQKNIVTIYFGGNGEDVIGMLATLIKFGGEDYYAFNYRGYGHSQGKPTQAALYADALAIFDEVAQRYRDKPTTRFLIVGRSLGTAVAGYLATQREVHGLILLTPLKSVIENGKRMLPFLPVARLVRHPFNLNAMAPDIRCPTLLLIAKADAVIPPTDSMETFASLTAEKHLMRLEGVGHNNVFDNPNALVAIQKFYRALADNTSMQTP